jgi:predicted nucleotidyltransferase
MTSRSSNGDAHGKPPRVDTARTVFALPRGAGSVRLGRLEAELEGTLGTQVDLIPAPDLKPGIRERIEADLIAL